MLLSALLASACMRAGSPDGDELVWKSFANARMDAKESKRKVLVDVYTSWCGWCKKMDRDVYANADVRKYLDEHFELAKLDAESAAKQKIDDGEFNGRDIAKSMGVSSYPTTVFFTDTGEMITAVPGYIDALINALKLPPDTDPNAQVKTLVEQGLIAEVTQVQTVVTSLQK